MASEMLKTVLNAENLANKEKQKAEKTAEKMIKEARAQAEKIVETARKQAESRANIILSDAGYSSSGVIKQAEKLAELREKKSINDTEKQYEEAIKMVFRKLLE